MGHNRTRTGVIEGLRDGVEVVVEEVGVGVQGHRCGRVAEHALHCFQVRDGGDGGPV
ncbi:hypothetical protein N1032_11045 [Herbiconiux sp. CPCC 203386]|uniref:Uncharacterized protein n=1 Tax=Herbiconiux daphne TaxID=2970914 RepID=A0ABT2H2V2_9MICO|nr:hypothetical protein [Herbiconiux daphne]MCS5734273.1 hypothetical protein [Herbiconiux daphne]